MVNVGTQSHNGRRMFRISVARCEPREKTPITQQHHDNHSANKHSGPRDPHLFGGLRNVGFKQVDNQLDGWANVKRFRLAE
jgi:hypothetical protein